MSSFSSPHFMCLFEMKNGKKKLAYGRSPEGINITPPAPDRSGDGEIIPDQYTKINQRHLQRALEGAGVSQSHMRLTPDQRRILPRHARQARRSRPTTLDGEKVHRLHPLARRSRSTPLSWSHCASCGLIQSNLKFPAATYILTDLVSAYRSRPPSKTHSCRDEVTSPLRALQGEPGFSPCR